MARSAEFLKFILSDVNRPSGASWIWAEDGDHHRQRVKYTWVASGGRPALW